MEPENLFPHSQVPATCLYPNSDRSSPFPTFHLLKIHLNIILPTQPESSKWFLSLGFPNKTMYKTLPNPIESHVTTF